MVLEAAGAVATAQQSVEVVRRGGAVALIGMSAEAVFEMPMMKLVSREIRLTGQFRYSNLYPAAIALVEAGRVNLAAIVNRRYPFARLPEAMSACARGNPAALKTMIVDF